MNAFIYLIKQAYLSLKEKPGFVFSVVSTMSITLGALLCVLTLTYVMLFKPLPYPDQDRLYSVEHQLINEADKIDGRAFIYPNLMYLHQHQTVFEQSALTYFDGAVLTSRPSEPMATISFVSPQWFDIFDAKMALGRGFEASENIDTFNPVTVLTYDFWQSEFNGAADILVEKVEFGGKSYRVIGVLAKTQIEFPLAGLGYQSQLYVPWDFNSVNENDRKAWGNDDGGLMFIGKLKAELIKNSSDKKINQQLTTLMNENWQMQVAEYDFFKGWRTALEINTLKSLVVDEGKRSVYLLLLGALGLVLIACANIANLFVSRTAERQQQLAIRAAVGASKAQLFRTIVAETGLLMFFAIMLAQVFVFIGFSLMQHYLVDFLPRIDELSLNAFSVLASIGLLTLLTFIFSHLCRKMIDYRALNATLQSSGKGNGIQVSKRIRNILISSQITVATVLIFINIVLYQDAKQLVDQPLGYQTENIFAAVLAVQSVESSLKVQRLTQLKTELLAQPKISAVSQSMRPSVFWTRAVIAEATNKRYSLSAKDVDEQYFSTINQAFIVGENFTVADRRDNNQVIVINDVLAKELAPMGSALGIKFTNGAQVIGVVKSINVPGQKTVVPRFYYPSALSRNMLMIKVHPGQNFSRDEMLGLLKKVHKKLSLFSFAALEDYKEQRLFASTTTAISSMVLTILTCFLSGLGLYGILSYSSQMRRFEIGTRLAIGAKSKDIVGLVFKENAGALGLGVTGSLLLLSALYLLFGESLNQYLTASLLPLFILTLGVIVILSSFACYLPLRQYITRPVVHSLKGDD